MPSPICSCITAGFGVKFLRRYQSPCRTDCFPLWGIPVTKTIEGREYPLKQAIGPYTQRARRPPEMAGIFQPCAATTLAAPKNIQPTVGYRQPSPKAHKKGPAAPIRHPHVCLAPYVRKNQVGCRLRRVGFTGFPYAKTSSPIVCSQWSAARVASRERTFPFSSEPRFDSGPFLYSRGKGRVPQAPAPTGKRTEAIRRGYRHLPEQLEDNIFSRYVKGIQTKANIFPDHRTPTARTVKTRQRAL